MIFTRLDVVIIFAADVSVGDSSESVSIGKSLDSSTTLALTEMNGVAQNDEERACIANAERVAPNRTERKIKDIVEQRLYDCGNRESELTV
jgi:hypothetical protein